LSNDKTQSPVLLLRLYIYFRSVRSNWSKFLLLYTIFQCLVCLNLVFFFIEYLYTHVQYIIRLFGEICRCLTKYKQLSVALRAVAMRYGRGSQSHLLVLDQSEVSVRKSRPVVPAPFLVSVFTHTFLLNFFTAPSQLCRFEFKREPDTSREKSTTNKKKKRNEIFVKYSKRSPNRTLNPPNPVKLGMTRAVKTRDIFATKQFSRNIRKGFSVSVRLFEFYDTFDLNSVLLSILESGSIAGAKNPKKNKHMK